MAELYGSGGGTAAGGQALERAKIKIIDDKGKSKEINVQFNPGSLNFSSSFNDSTMNSAAGTGDGKTSSGKASADTTMSVDLLFDAVNNAVKQRSEQPAYMTRKPGGKTGETRFFPEVSGDVSKNVNDFYSAMTGENGRVIEFMWGKMHFRGILTSVSMEITLFDRQANPLRANVKLQIRGNG